jgi:hypothetical protein
MCKDCVEREPHPGPTAHNTCTQQPQRQQQNQKKTSSKTRSRCSAPVVQYVLVVQAAAGHLHCHIDSSRARQPASGTQGPTANQLHCNWRGYAARDSLWQIRVQQQQQQQQQKQKQQKQQQQQEVKKVNTRALQCSNKSAAAPDAARHHYIMM